ncbi:MAG: malate dehydrogenase [Albidovulum sp.]|nr:malate dehydrogenase [Albidovulum sp.]MDE0530054.1 malate dehydrogenase [Albidovulum sp.]
MSVSRRVIGSEQVEKASRGGRRYIEVPPGGIVTVQARETAERLDVALRDGPLDRPQTPETDGAAALYRVLYRRSSKWMAPKPPAGRNPLRFRRIAIIGAGGVGGNIAHLAAARDAAGEIVIVDVVPGLAESIALDLNHSSGATRSKCAVSGSADPSASADADVVVVTAGRARSPGMSRADLLAVNRRTIRALGEKIRAASPGAVVIVVSNPLDEMTAEMLWATEFPRERVMGMAGTLDSARFRAELAHAARVGIDEVEAMVIGSHGGEMTPLVSLARIRGMPLDRFLDGEQISGCVERTISAGAKVVELRRTASASIAPAHAALELLDHMRGARVGPVPATVHLRGEFGIEGVPLGVPCLLGPKGLAEVAELTIDASERAKLKSASEAVRARIGS